MEPWQGSRVNPSAGAKHRRRPSAVHHQMPRQQIIDAALCRPHFATSLALLDALGAPRLRLRGTPAPLARIRSISAFGISHRAPILTARICPPSISRRIVKWLTPKSFAASPIPLNVSAIAANSCSRLANSCAFPA